MMIIIIINITVKVLGAGTRTENKVDVSLPLEEFKQRSDLRLRWGTSIKVGPSPPLQRKAN